MDAFDVEVHADRRVDLRLPPARATAGGRGREEVLRIAAEVLGHGDDHVRGRPAADVGFRRPCNERGPWGPGDRVGDLGDRAALRQPEIRARACIRTFGIRGPVDHGLSVL